MATLIKLLSLLGLFLLIPFAAVVLLLLAPFVLVYFLLNRVCLTVEYLADMKRPLGKKRSSDKRSSGFGELLSLYNGISDNKKKRPLENNPALSE